MGVRPPHGVSPLLLLADAILAGVKITCVAPYDFDLSWRLVTAFGGPAREEAAISMWWADRPTVVRMEQIGRRPPIIEVNARPGPARPKSFAGEMEKILNAGLALEPFYRRARQDEILAPIVKRLGGLKPFRPPDLFQMMVTAITEQQISLAAAGSIRERVVQRYGTSIEGMPVFPQPRDIAALSLEKLRACGLSERKAEYIRDLARMMESGEINSEGWEELPDDQLMALISSYRGFGEWTAAYIMLRGLGRMDIIPAADIGIRKLIGIYFGDGGRPPAEEVKRILEPWSPWRGLVAFYLIADSRLSHMGLDQAQ
jgi:DNA-3-methyladenine glycosylase II